ncbi:RidA family protein [Kineosporia mesophila]|uniref:RidA family protein n=1 Tax=Kineosporia mesophila TaxID=566012 RepID=A0ABP6ZNE4_9ACTN|nr:RidA family protein [Kineosporia mesophila]
MTGASDPVPGSADPVRPQGRYRPAALSGDLVISAGMTPREGGTLLATGTLGVDVDVEQGAELAGVCVRRAVSAMRAALPPGGRLTEIAEMLVFVRGAADFTQHSKVADGASDTLDDLLEGCLPARTAVGVLSLPGGAPVEVRLMGRWDTGPGTGER